MDNFFQQCPPKMYGRWLGDYRTATRRNEYNKYLNGIHRDDDYRAMLQKNADQIMNQTWDNYKVKSCKQLPCVFKDQGRFNPSNFNKEMDKSNESMKLPKTASFPVAYNDFRMTNTFQ